MKQNLTYLLLFFIALFICQSGTAQIPDKKLTLTETELTGLTLVKAIKNQAGLRFNYGEVINAKLSAPVKIDKQQITVKEALELIKTTYGISYEVSGEYITLLQKTTATPVPATPQKGPGKVTGKIIDEENGQPIVGVTIRIGNKGITSDENGFFTISLSKGKYEAEISSLGFVTKKVIEITIKEDETFTLDIPLKREKGQLGTVTVSARRIKETGTNAAIVNEIREADAVVSGISKEQISRSQDRDAAEVVRRIPGVSIIQNRFIVIRGLPQRYNTVMLNNALAPSFEADSRAFSFDIIPSGMIDRIMIYKTAVPELPGDFAGGIVKVYTTTVPVRNSFTINYSSSYNTNTTFRDFYEQPQGKYGWLGYDDGTYKLPSFREGGLMPRGQSTYEERKAITKLFNQNWEAKQKTAPPDQRLNLNLSRRIFLSNQIKMGVIGSLGYSNTYRATRYSRTMGFRKAKRLDTDTTFFNSYGYAFSDDIYVHDVRVSGVANVSLDIQQGRHRIDFKNLYTHMGSSIFVDRFGFVGDNPAEETGIHAGYVEQPILANSFRGVYSGQLNGSHELFGKATQLNWLLGYTKSNFDEPDERHRTRTASTVDSAGTPQWGSWKTLEDRVDPRRNSRYYYSLLEDTKTAGMDIIQKISVGNWYPVLKAGFYYEYKNRNFTTRWLGPSKKEEDALQESELTWNTYSASNQLKAAYLSAEIPFLERFKLHGGVRVEDNHLKLYSRQSWQSTGPDAGPVNVDKQATSWLPSLNLSYNITEKTLVRAAYSQTLNRPEFRETSAAYYFDMAQFRYIYGQPNLKTKTDITNYDLRLEHYPAPGEMISLGLFYKKFKDPIELKFEAASSGIAFMWANANEAVNYGAELDMMLGMGRYFSGTTWASRQAQKLSVLLNAAYLFSEVDFGDNAGGEQISQKRPLFGQSPYTINAGISYADDSTGMKLNVSYNIIGKRIITVGSRLQPNVYELPRHSLDLTASKRISKVLELRAGIQNMLNARFLQMQDSDGDGKFTAPGTLVPDASWKDGHNLSWYDGAYYTIGLNIKL